MRLSELIKIYEKCKQRSGCMYCDERKKWNAGICPMQIGFPESFAARLCDENVVDVLRRIETRIENIK